MFNACIFAFWLNRCNSSRAVGRRRPALKHERGTNMNKVRRGALREIIDKITDARDALEMLKDEEEEYRDNMPENLQGSERFQTADEACESLYEAVSQLEEAVDNIETAIGE